MNYLQQLIFILLCSGFVSPLYSHPSNNATLNYYTEVGISHYMSGNFDEALDDFNHAISHSESPSDILFAAHLMRALTYRQLEKPNSCSIDIAFLQDYAHTWTSIGSKDDFVKCNRTCEAAESAAYVLCGSLLAKGYKGAFAAAACSAAVKILSRECEDCCVDGFADCGKKIETFVKDILDSTFPTDSSILDSP